MRHLLSVHHQNISEHVLCLQKDKVVWSESETWQFLFALLSSPTHTPHIEAWWHWFFCVSQHLFLFSLFIRMSFTLEFICNLIVCRRQSLVHLFNMKVYFVLADHCLFLLELTAKCLTRQFLFFNMTSYLFHSPFSRVCATLKWPWPLMIQLWPTLSRYCTGDWQSGCDRCEVEFFF